MPNHYYYKNLKSKIKYGGSAHENLRQVLMYVDPQKIVNYKNWEDTGMAFEDKNYLSRCCCDHKIRYIHIVKHKKTGDTLEIGTTCIKKFRPDDEKAKAEVDKRVRRIKKGGIYCEKCDGTVSQKIVDEFKKQGMTKFYHKKCLNMCYQCGDYKDYTCQCHFNYALEWRMRYGKYIGISMREMLNDPKKINHIAYLLKTSTSETLLDIIKTALSAPTDLIKKR